MREKLRQLADLALVVGMICTLDTAIRWIMR